MPLEQDIANLVQASNGLTGVVDSKIQDIDARVNQAQAQVDGFIAGARSETPFYRLTKNQVLAGTSGSVPDFWLSGTGVTYTLVQSVDSNKLWANRTVEEQALLTAMGRSNVDNIHVSFNIWRMEWTSNTPVSYMFYQRVGRSSVVTSGAMMKLLSGELTDGYAVGIMLNEWRLTGRRLSAGNLRYAHEHAYRNTPAGAALFALPAIVAGYVPLEANIWGSFPYIGDTQND